MSFKDFVDKVETDCGIIDEIIEQRESKGELTDRVENLKELLSEAAEFEKNHRGSLVENDDEFLVDEEDEFLAEEVKTADTLQGLLSLYLENAALYAQGDSDDDSEDFVKLMTIHSAKGLEFGAVFLIGVEDGIFPSYKSISAPKDLEEERRLMYVAITRAKKNLFIVLTRQRMIFGQTQCFPPSRFLREISPDHLYRMGSAREVEKKPASEIMSPARAQAGKSIARAMKSSVSAPSKKPAGSLDPSSLTKGMEVIHDRFGEGVIIKVEPVAGDALITVDFDGMKKNMLLRTSGLRKK